LHFRIIEDTFGTKLRIRHSGQGARHSRPSDEGPKPSAGCENHQKQHHLQREKEKVMSSVSLGGFAGYAIPDRSVAASSHLRMTKRGRAVLLTAVATPLVVVALAFGINAGNATATSSSTPLARVTVVGGETLWGVARQIAPNADPRDVVADLMSVNRLSSADIHPGEQLSIPAQYGR
jgi:LysM repeat protein